MTLQYTTSISVKMYFRFLCAFLLNFIVFVTNKILLITLYHSIPFSLEHSLSYTHTGISVCSLINHINKPIKLHFPINLQRKCVTKHKKSKKNKTKHKQQKRKQSIENNNNNCCRFVVTFNILKVSDYNTCST